MSSRATAFDVWAPAIIMGLTLLGPLCIGAGFVALLLWCQT